MTFKLKITTPHGDFTRNATKQYTHAVVRISPRAQAALARSQDPSIRCRETGVQGRWVKDRGFAVTWHGSEAAARAAATKPYVWDSKTGPATVYRVEADLPILAALLPRVG